MDGNINAQQLFMMMGAHEVLSNTVKAVLRPAIEQADMGLVLVVAVGGALLYMANKHAWYGRLSCYLRNRGRSSVSVSAQINVDMTGEDWNLPKRFLAILHVVHHRITTQKVSARCTGIEISTCMPGATDSYDMRIAYMVPDVEVAIMEGDLRIAVIVDIDTGDKNNRRGEVEQSWDDWGNMTSTVLPKASVEITLRAKCSSSELDRILASWEKRYEDDLKKRASDKLSVLRPVVKYKRVTYMEHPLGEVMLSDIVLSKETRRQLDGLVRAIQDPDRFRCIGADYQVNILLHGPPGTGKTTIAKAIARTLSRYLLHVRLTMLDTVDMLEEVFTRPGGRGGGIGCADVVYLLDELDHGIKELLDKTTWKMPVDWEEELGRGGKGKGKGKAVTDRTKDAPTVQSIKAVLDGALNVPGRVVVATSNSIDRLNDMGEDSSFLRARRMECIYVGLCDAEMLRQFWRRIFGEGHELEEEVASLPEDVLAPAEVSSVLLSNYGRPDTALLDLKRMVAAKQTTPAEDKKEGENEENEKEDENKSEEEKDGNDKEEKKGGSRDVNVHVTLHGVRVACRAPTPALTDCCTTAAQTEAFDPAELSADNGQCTARSASTGLLFRDQEEGLKSSAEGADPRGAVYDEDCGWAPSPSPRSAETVRRGMESACAEERLDSRVRAGCCESDEEVTVAAGSKEISRAGSTTE